MPEEKKYPNYTAADIEKYHKGLLSPKEMNEMERAALDDPFLADALEGYGNVKVNISADMEELKERLAKRTGEGKMIRMIPPFGFSKLLRIAAIVVLIAGAGLFIYRFGFNNSNHSLAVEQVPQKEQQKSKQSEAANTTAPLTVDSIRQSATGNAGSATSQWKYSSPAIKADSANVVYNGAASSNVFSQKDSVSFDFSLKEELNKKSPPTVDRGYATITNAEVKTQVTKPSQAINQKVQFGNDMRLDSSRQTYRKNEGAFAMANPGFDVKQKRPVPSNYYFNGRVVDNANNAVPFANVTNIRDNVGTYADANGFFTLISTDTALNLRFKSVGFQSDTVQLRSNALLNQVTLREDKMNGVVLGGKRLGEKPNPQDNIKVEEPEPADGWSNYGLYLANNLKVPDAIRKKEIIGEVQLSFEINKLGEPTNIKVEKSLCKECDEEAKRLITQGPKWKIRKKKNNRVTITVPFTNE